MPGRNRGPVLQCCVWRFETNTAGSLPLRASRMCRHSGSSRKRRVGRVNGSVLTSVQARRCSTGRRVLTRKYSRSINDSPAHLRYSPLPSLSTQTKPASVTNRIHGSTTVPRHIRVLIVSPNMEVRRSLLRSLRRSRPTSLYASREHRPKKCFPRRRLKSFFAMNTCRMVRTST